MPSEADFEAIEAAVQETARGRWFLAEYARRNRHADTAEVLAAVERLEGRLAERSESRPDQPPASFAEALARGRAELSGLAPVPREAGDHLSAIAEGLRDLAWELRETGRDLKICAVLDRFSAGMAESSLALQAASRRAALAGGILDMLHERLSPGSEQVGEASAPTPTLPAVAEHYDPPPATPSEPTQPSAPPLSLAPLQIRPWRPPVRARPGTLEVAANDEGIWTIEHDPQEHDAKEHGGGEHDLPGTAQDEAAQLGSAAEPLLRPDQAASAAEPPALAEAAPDELDLVPTLTLVVSDAREASTQDASADDTDEIRELDAAQLEQPAPDLVREIRPAPLWGVAIERNRASVPGRVSLAEIEALPFEEKVALFS